MADKQQL